MYRKSWCRMLVLRILIFIFIFRPASMEVPKTKNANNYGPCNIKYHNYKLCAGPRSKNVTITSSEMFTDEYGSIITYNQTYLVAAKIEEFRIIVWNIKGNERNPLWNYKVTKPCQHFLFNSLMKQYYPTMRNCVIPPGNYVYKTNYTDIALRFFSNSFFYGEYIFKLNAIAKQGNMLCMQINSVITKRV